MDQPQRDMDYTLTIVRIGHAFVQSASGQQAGTKTHLSKSCLQPHGGRALWREVPGDCEGPHR